MKELTSLKDLQLGQKVAWRYMDSLNLGFNEWICIGQVKGFAKRTTYPKKHNGQVYTSKELIIFDVLHKSNSSFLFLLSINPAKNEIECYYTNTGDNLFKIFLLENEADYLFVIKHIMAESL